MSRMALPVSLLFVISACGPQATGLDTDADPLIIGDLDWRDVSSLDPDSAQRRRARSVGYLSLPARGTRCTAFLVAPDVVMTNHHCVPNAASARDARFDPTRETGVSASQRVRFACDEWLGSNAELDFALLRCAGEPGRTFGVLGLQSRAAVRAEPVYVIQQNCDYYSLPGCEPTKVVAEGSVTPIGARLAHDADTLGGSSGSPVLSSNSHAVLALHNAGVGDDGHGRGIENRAVPMRRIVPYLQLHFPQVNLQAVEPDETLLGEAEPDNYEPNNDQATATVWQPEAPATGLTLHAGDEDVFEIVVSAPGALSVQVSFQHAFGDIDAALTQGSVFGPTVASAVSGDDDEQISLQDAAPGTYYLRVYGYQGASNRYTLSVDLPVASQPAAPAPPSPPAPAQPGEMLEPNNTQSEAPVLARPFDMQQGLRIADGADVDYYAFDSDGSPTAITLSFVNASGDLDLFVEDSAGVAVATSNGTTDQESIEQTFAVGRYFIKVAGYASASGAYSLSIR